MEKEESLHIFTDGACSGNPGPGGWGVVFRHPRYQQEFCGWEPQTTNNRMELMAAIQALQNVTQQGLQLLELPIVLYSDSQYVIHGITQWILQWRCNGWRTSQKKPVENKDLWEALWELKIKIPNLSWQWIRGHAGHPENELADRLAKKYLQQTG